MKQRDKENSHDDGNDDADDVLFFAFVVALIWLGGQELNKRKLPPRLFIPPQQDAYPPYEQGYQPPPRAPETYQEGGQQYPYQPQPQYDQPQVQYPQLQEVPAQD